MKTSSVRAKPRPDRGVRSLMAALLNAMDVPQRLDTAKLA
jgi:hypothetical protein